MPPRPINWGMYFKMFTSYVHPPIPTLSPPAPTDLLSGAVICIGGPALVYYVSPTEEQLFLKYNTELQKRSLENRIGRQQDFDNFVGKLKEYSKSDKPIWEAAAEDEKSRREGNIQEQQKLMEEMKRRKEEMRKEGGLVPRGSL
jgi:1,4-alpha-glucan branching enzyme